MIAQAADTRGVGSQQIRRWSKADSNSGSHPRATPPAATRFSLLTPCWSKPDSNSRSHPLTRRQTHGSDRMNGAERDTFVGSGSLVTLDPGATKREIARSFPVQTRGHYPRREALDLNCPPVQGRGRLMRRKEVPRVFGVTG
jgi:hypothetical protein